MTGNRSCGWGETCWPNSAWKPVKRKWQPTGRIWLRDSLNQGYNVAVHVGHGYRNVMHVGDDNLTGVDASAVAISIMAGADYVVYGPLEYAKRAMPVASFADKMMEQAVRDL